MIWDRGREYRGSRDLLGRPCCSGQFPLTCICTLQQLTLLQNTFENSDTIIPKITKKNAKEWDGDVLVKKHSWSFFIFNGRFR